MQQSTFKHNTTVALRRHIAASSAYAMCRKSIWPGRWVVKGEQF